MTLIRGNELVNDIRVAPSRTRRMRAILAAAMMSCTALTLGIIPAPAAAQTQTAVDFAIPAGPLATVLNRFADQSGTEIIYNGSLTEGLSSSGLAGRFGTAEALSRILAGTGLTFRQTGARTFTLERAPQPSADGGGAIQLGPVRVEGETGTGVSPSDFAISDPGRTEGSPDYAAPSTNTAFKVALTPQQTPQTVIVVPQAAIRDFNLTTVKEVLEFTPGVFVRPERSRDYYDFQSRGYEMQVQYDGVPSPNGMGGRSRSITPDTAIIDRVEVLQGASGLMSGAGAPGGIVNMFRKMPALNPFIELQAGADTWGGWRGMVDVAGPISDSGLGGRLVAVMEERGSYIDYVSGKHAVLYGVLEQRLGDRTTLALGATFEKIFDYSPGSHYGFPTQADGTLYPNMSRSKNWGATWSDLEETSYNIFLRAQHQFSDRWSMQALLTYEDFKTSSLQGVPGRLRDVDLWPILLFGAQAEAWNSENLSLDIAVQGEFSLLGRDHQVMFGFNGSTRDFGGSGGASAGALAFDYDPYSWDAREVPGPYSTGWDDYGSWSGKQYNYGAYAGGRFELLKSVHALVGARVSWYKQSYDGVLDSKDAAVITPYGALTWDIIDNLTSYASYTEIFQPQFVGTRDRNNRVLNPVTGENKELGLKLALLDGKLTAQGAYFWLDQVNVAEPDYAGEFPGVCGGLLDPCSQPSGKIRAKGWDVSVAGEILPGLKVLGGYSRVENDGSYFAPERKQANFAISYTAPDDRWMIGATVQHHSGWSVEEPWFFAPDSGNTWIKGEDRFTVVGLNGRYKINQNLDATVEVSNLFDKKYLAEHDYPANGSVWGDPRRVTFMLRARF